MTLVELQSKRDGILQQMGETANEVQFADRRVNYKPQGELADALRQIDAEIAKLSTTESSRTFTIQTNRGIR